MLFTLFKSFDNLRLLIQLHRLEGFYWVAKCEGYARAARAFPYPISQPGVHSQVRKLEEDLGQPLFERVAKDRVRLAPAGRALYEFCAPFFEELPQVVQAVQAGSQGGELRIDGVGLTVRGIIPGWVRKIREKHSEIRVHLEEIRGSGLDRLRLGESDILVDFLAESPPDIESQKVGLAHTFLVLPKDHRLAKRKRISLDEMEDDVFVSYPKGSSHEKLQRAGLERFSVVPKEFLSASSADSILAFVRSGLGYSLIPWLSVEGPEEDNIASIRLTGRETNFPIMASWLHTRYTSPLVEKALKLAPKK